jgi:hypothetical protein
LASAPDGSKAIAGVFIAAAKPQPNNVHAIRKNVNPIFVMNAPTLFCCVETRATVFKKAGTALPALQNFAKAGSRDGGG